MRAYERKQLLERIDREGSTIGTRIPETITIQGEPVALGEFVFECQRRETTPPVELERIDRARRSLRRERRERRDRLATADIDRAEGERLVESIIGLDRALEALNSLEPISITDEMKSAAMADHRRWLSFLKQIGGNEHSSSRIR